METVALRIAELKDTDDRLLVDVTGIVTDLRVRTTRRGEPMAWVHLADGTGVIEAVVFPAAYGRIGRSAILREGAYLGVRGRMAHEPTGAKLFVDDVWPLGGAGAKLSALVVSVQPSSAG